MTQGLMLAAGMGKRISELTKDYTKCMIKVNDQTLLSRTINSFKKASINKLIIVAGYKIDILKKYISASFPDLDITIIENNKYFCTNNIYSLFLAKDYLGQDDTILVESDLIYEENLIDSLINYPKENVAVVAKYKDWMDGTVIKKDNNLVTNIIEKNNMLSSDMDLYYKTVNIYKFSKNFSISHLIPELVHYINQYGVNCYYELALKSLIDSGYNGLYAMDLVDLAWYEIDTINDYNVACKLFK